MGVRVCGQVVICVCAGSYGAHILRVKQKERKLILNYAKKDLICNCLQQKMT